MRQALGEYAVTFFTLLSEAGKLDNYSKRWDLTASAYPHMDDEAQEELTQSLQLPDDLLSDILDSETRDDINTLKDALDGN